MSTTPTTTRLLSQLEHGTEVEAFEAAKLLSHRNGVKLKANLARLMRSGDQAYTREAAAYALSWLHDRKAAEALLACAADSGEQDSVRAQAVEGLDNHFNLAPRKTKLQLKAEDLMLLMLDSPSATLRFWACFGLGLLRCQRAIPHLCKIAREDTSVYPGWWHVSEEAEDALEWIAGRTGKDRTPIHMWEAANPAVGKDDQSKRAKPKSKRKILLPESPRVE